MMMMMPIPSTATVRVDKATSDLLINPDWSMNIGICDYINSNPGQSREFVKAVKRRLQHKHSNVQLLALTLLETMVKNCGEYIHFQIAEKNIPSEMVRIVKKKGDTRVREKILGLLDSWQEAFSGTRGKHPQYHYAYEELRRSGVQFPRRSVDSSPIFTPPVNRPTLRHTQSANSSRRLDETMATEIEGLSMSTISSMREVMDLLSDMLQAVNPRDRDAVKDEVIVELVSHCQTNQKQLMQMITTTSDEELLGRALELNDAMQIILAKHDAIASGSPLLSLITVASSLPAETHGLNSKDKDVKTEDGPSGVSVASPTTSSANAGKSVVDEHEEEDDFTQLARRHSKSQSASPESSTGGEVCPETPKPADLPSNCTALTLADPDPSPAPVKISKEQDMIDFLSLALTTTPTSAPETPEAPSFTINAESIHGNPYNSQPYSVPQDQVSYNSYVVPWAQPQSPQQPQLQQQPQIQTRTQPNPYQPQYFQSSYQPVQPQYTQATTQRYIPPPWATTPGYLNSGTGSTFWTPRAEMGTSYSPFADSRPLQHVNSFPARGINGSTAAISDPRNIPSTGPKPFIPSYRLFEDLNVLSTSSASPGLSGSTGQSMIGGRR